MARLNVSDLDSTSPIPLWVQLVEHLRHLIETNQFGEKFPSELELQVQFGVSRSTVRQAIRHLRAEGYLDPQQGRGTFIVARERFDSLNNQRFSLAARMADTGLEEVCRVLRVEEVHSEEVASRLRLYDDRFLLVERLRGSDRLPVALERAWIVFEYGSVLEEVDLSRGTLYELLESEASLTITSGSDEVLAELPSKEDAKLLKVRKTHPVLAIEREASSWAQPVEFRRTVLVPERVSFVARWGR